MDTPTTHVEINANDPFQPTVSLNGEQVERHLYRATLDMQAQEPPKLFLELRAGSTYDFEGQAVVHVVREVPSDPLEAVREFLGNIDPDELDKALLDQFGGLSGDVTTGQACLAVLKAWAGGD